jgi:hypothetical protein
MERLRVKFVILIFILSSPRLYSGDPGFQFLRVGVTARGTALGDAYTSQFGDVNTFMYNPASVSQLGARQMAASYTNHLLDIGSGFIAYAQPVKNYGVFGAGIIYFGYGDFQGYDVNGNETKKFAASDFALNVFYAHTYRKIHYGANVKFIESAIADYSSTALALDLGAIYTVEPWGVQVGASVLNAGFATKAFIQHKEALPLSIQLGASKKLDRAPMVISFSLSDLNQPGSVGDRLKRFSLATEWNPVENFFIRGGFNNQRRSEMKAGSSSFLDKITGLTAGVGFKHQRYTLDYSFASWGIGAINRISFTVNL